MKNARRNRKRTFFLILLVAVPVAFGVIVAGIVRASTLTPEEQAQQYFGSAGARIQVAAVDPAVADWVRNTADNIDPQTTITELRNAGIRIEGVGYAQVWDLDMSHPATKGFLLPTDGRPPRTETEVAISPSLAEEMAVEVGDTVEFEHLPVGELEVVGLVSEPFFVGGAQVLLSPGALTPLQGDPDVGAESSLLLSGPDAENVALQLNDQWYADGQRQFWPEPAVDPLPRQLEFLDEAIYLLLTEAEIEALVEVVETFDGTEQEMIDAVWERAADMAFQGREYRSLPELYVETRSQWLSFNSLESNPGVMSTGAAAILLVEVAFITGAAFAAGTRRRLREIGLMGANGAAEKHVRATVVGEGLTIGAVGALFGVILGVAVMVLARPILQRFVSRVIVGVGVGFLDALGPVAVALIAVVLAVLVPARTASRVPTTTALQGRMPALSPRKWVVPVGIAMAAAGFLLISVSLASVSSTAGVLVGVGATAVVGGVAMLSSPVLAGVSRLANKVPATSRLVLRDSGRNRTRSAVAVAAIMVILLAPITAVITSATTAERDLIYGLPEPRDHLVLEGRYASSSLGGLEPISDTDVAALAAIVPEDEIAVFDALDLQVVTNEILNAREKDNSEDLAQSFTEGYPAAIASSGLVAVLDDPGLARSIEAGEIVVLGVEDKETRVSINDVEYRAHEYPVAVMKWRMPRVLIPESLASEFAGAETMPMALFTLERSMTEDEYQRLWSSELEVTGGYGYMEASTIYLLAGGLTLIVVLIVVALVTAVSAAEVDHELNTIVAVGAPGSMRRRYLGLLTGYQTLVAMVLALPLGLGLVWVFSSAQDYVTAGPFGVVHASAITVPWTWLLGFAVILPVSIGLLTLISVRSAPVTPPRRAT